jgi:hypothetical protein
MKIPKNTPLHTTAVVAAVATALAVTLPAPTWAAETYGAGTPAPAAMTEPVPSGVTQPKVGAQVDQFSIADSNKDGILSRGEFDALQRSHAAQAGTMASSDTSSGLMGKRVKDVKDKAVHNQGGKKIGEVEDVVTSNQDHQLYAVISVGGFLGIGKSEITLPLSQLTWQSDKLVASTVATKKELKAMPKYQEASYRELDDNQIIGAPGGMSSSLGSSMGPTFDALDANRDDQIERSEFSAFESWEATQPGYIAPGAPGSSDYRDNR